MVHEIIVIKKARSSPLQDKPINFPPLINLHLELIENKKKLKKSLPPLQITKARPPPPVVTPVAVAVASTKPVSAYTPPPKEDDGESVAASDGDMLEDLGDIDAQSNISLAASVAAGSSRGDGGAAAAEDIPVEEDDPYAGLSPEEREAKEKEEYIWRFRILKKKHKGRAISEYTEHDDLITMKTDYDRTIKELTLDENVDSYRSYLVAGWWIIEWGATYWAGVDFNGFSQQQMLLMPKYDPLLVELGERSYNRWGMNLPVEIKLIGFILLQAGLFYLCKIIAQNAGCGMAELFRGITGQPAIPVAEKTEAAASPPRKKMRGPSYKPADIRKMAKPDPKEDDDSDED